MKFRTRLAEFFYAVPATVKQMPSSRSLPLGVSRHRASGYAAGYADAAKRSRPEYRTDDPQWKQGYDEGWSDRRSNRPSRY